MPTLPQHEAHVDALSLEAMELYARKNKEYAAENDCYANFNALAQDVGLRPEQVAWVYAAKHVRSIQEALRSGKYTGRAETLRGRIIDLINYLGVISFMTEERVKEIEAKHAER